MIITELIAIETVEILEKEFGDNHTFRLYLGISPHASIRFHPTDTNLGIIYFHDHAIELYNTTIGQPHTNIDYADPQMIEKIIKTINEYSQC